MNEAQDARSFLLLVQDVGQLIACGPQRDSSTRISDEDRDHAVAEGVHPVRASPGESCQPARTPPRCGVGSSTSGARPRLERRGGAEGRHNAGERQPQPMQEARSSRTEQRDALLHVIGPGAREPGPIALGRRAVGRSADRSERDARRAPAWMTATRRSTARHWCRRRSEAISPSPRRSAAPRARRRWRPGITASLRVPASPLHFECARSSFLTSSQLEIVAECHDLDLDCAEHARLRRSRQVADAAAKRRQARSERRLQLNIQLGLSTTSST